MRKLTNCYGGKSGNKSAKLVRYSQKNVFLQPSSAAVKRVFSLINSGLGTQQEQSLQGYIQASVMLRYNNH